MQLCINFHSPSNKKKQLKKSAEHKRGMIFQSHYINKYNKLNTH